MQSVASLTAACSGQPYTALPDVQDARKLSWKARARSHNSGLDDPLSRAFSEDASSPDANTVW